ncbi:MAG TPA: PKD domain-containing protein [Bacteroidia bacterium]|nr:PKD domain-containing protein [Bacteroidia bacterium]
MKKHLLLLCMSCLWLLSGVSAQVSFNANITSGCGPLSVIFTNNSSVGNYYVWDFHDGNSPKVYTYNTTHTFINGGNYYVNLNVYDTTGHGMMPKGSYSMNIQVNGSSLNTSADTVCPNEIFSAYINPNGNNYSWTFGDGGSSTQSNPQHTYTNLGVDTLKVTVNTGGMCGMQHFKTVVVVKANAKPSANFGSSSFSSCPTDPITFYPRNQNASSYSWTFGDGGTSTQSMPSHAYASTGNYPVKLTITSSCGTTATYTDTARIQGNIHFGSGSSISSSGFQGCPGDNFNFNYYGGSAKSMTWKFGTGDSLSGQNVNYSFATAATYTVTLRLHNGCNNDTTLSKVIQVKSNLPFTGNAQMQVFPNPVCPNDAVFTNSSSGSAYKWYSGNAAHDSSSAQKPSFSYSSVGTYTVSLKLYNGCGRDTLITSTVIVNNSAPAIPPIHSGNNNNWGSPSSSACPGDTVIFFTQIPGNLLWTFGDGTSTTHSTPINAGNGTAYIVKHVYSTTGNFNVKLTVTNGCGNSATDSLSYPVGGSSPVNGSINFIGNKNNNNNNNQYTFNTCEMVDILGAGGSSYKWYFGNGDSIITTQAEVHYKYLTAGTYTIKLVVKNGCGNTGTYYSNVIINGMNTSLVSTNLLCNSAGNGQIVTNVNGGFTPYRYSLNNGPYFSSGTFANLTAGSYTITVKDSAGCLVTATSTLTQPTALSLSTSSTNSTCGNSNGGASVVVSGGTPAYTYSWQGGASTSSITNVAAGSYQITVSDANGCTSNKNVAVSDNGGPAVTFSNTIAPVCISAGSFALTGGSPAGGTYSGVGVSGGAFYNPAAAGAGVHQVSYTYTNTGCTASATNTITVNALPHVSIASNPPNGSVCAGSSLTLTATGASTYSWTGSITNGVAFTPAGPGSYTVTATDANNCSATANIGVTVNALPTVTLNFTGHDTTGSCQSSVNLTGGTPAGGNYSGTGVNNNSFSPSAVGNGNYTITYMYSDSHGCSASKSAVLHVLPCPLFIQEQTLNPLKVYPNPSNGIITVETPGQTGTLEVMNLIGEVLYTQKITQMVETLSLNTQANGVYLIRMVDAKGISVQRIIIQK